MKKTFAIIAALALVGVVRCQAQTTNIEAQINISLKGKLAPDHAAVTGESLSGNTNTLSILVLEVINGAVTNIPIVIGQATVVAGVTNIVPLLEQMGNIVDLTPTATTSDKSLAVFGGSAGTATNATLFISATDKIDKSMNESISAKFQGIWNDDDAVSGTISPVKVKK